MGERFTPGPWYYPGPTSVTPDFSAGTVHQNVGRGMAVAHIAYAGGRDEAEANALLIAAAPEMLSALKVALVGLEITGRGATATAITVRQAIAKATPPNEPSAAMGGGIPE